MKNIALLFAGGTGKRMGAELPKQFLKVNEKPIICYTIEKFDMHKEIDEIYIVSLEDYIDYTWNLVKKFNYKKVKKIISGGDTGQESIYNGLEAIKKDVKDDKTIVLIHDGVRPFLPEEVITKNIESVKKFGSAITATPCFETIVFSKLGKEVDSIPLRDESYTVQAPQSFFLDEILEAHQKIREDVNNYDGIVCSCTLFEKVGNKAHLIEGHKGNIKVTTPIDFYIMKALVEYEENLQAIGFNEGGKND